jgi:hypothetical protein
MMYSTDDHTTTMMTMDLTFSCLHKDMSSHDGCINLYHRIFLTCSAQLSSRIILDQR